MPWQGESPHPGQPPSSRGQHRHPPRWGTGGQDHHIGAHAGWGCMPRLQLPSPWGQLSAEEDLALRGKHAPALTQGAVRDKYRELFPFQTSPGHPLGGMFKPWMLCSAIKLQD